MSNCTKCHDLGKKVSTFKCLTCHTEIRDLINLKRGYHSNKEVTDKLCWDCHGEHYGRKFEIVRFDEKSFDHNKAGFDLNGSHKNLDCKKCHKSAFLLDEKLKRKNKTFLGLGIQCNSCHEDSHQSTLGNDCFSCHNEDKFIPAIKFNHKNTNFVLTGSHKKVDCSQCHNKEQRNGRLFKKFNGIKFSSCESCHKDVHRGKFGNDCKSCHNTESFKEVNITSKFNHSRTDFALIGKHKYVKCEMCHKNDLTKPIKHKKCINCHKDYHEGEFIKNNTVQDCKECHNEYGFSPSLFTIEQHSKTKFALNFAHTATPCTACHFEENKWYFKIDGSKCISCHANIHGNEISKEFFNEDMCESCHTVRTWNDLNFDHNKTEFKLTGKHENTNCSDCHFEYTDEKLIRQKFSGLNSNCTQCHNDIHFGQFIEEKEELCENCHTTTNWQPIIFNHSKTRFAIDGVHQKILCNECHKTVEKGNDTFVQYKIEDVRCISCHS